MDDGTYWIGVSDEKGDMIHLDFYARNDPESEDPAGERLQVGVRLDGNADSGGTEEQ